MTILDSGCMSQETADAGAFPQPWQRPAVPPTCGSQLGQRRPDLLRAASTTTSLLSTESLEPVDVLSPTE